MQVKIPKDSVGIVIGRQGANIREIQVETLSLTLDLEPRTEICLFYLEPKTENVSQAKTETRINFRDELETEEYRVAAIRLDNPVEKRLKAGCRQTAQNSLSRRVKNSKIQSSNADKVLKILLRGTPDGAQLAEILIHQTLAQQPRFIISLDIIFTEPNVSNTLNQVMVILPQKIYY